VDHFYTVNNYERYPKRFINDGIVQKAADYSFLIFSQINKDFPVISSEANDICKLTETKSVK
jgi:hypothetical protein